MNSLRYPPPGASNELKQPSEPRKRKKISRAAHIILDGSFLTREKMIRLIPFILYLMLLAIIHVANSYRAEKTWYEINRIKTEMDELRYHYVTSQSTLMSLGKQSEVAQRLEKTGMREATAPPIRLNTPLKETEKPSSNE